MAEIFHFQNPHFVALTQTKFWPCQKWEDLFSSKHIRSFTRFAKCWLIWLNVFNLQKWVKKVFQFDRARCKTFKTLSISQNHIRLPWIFLFYFMSREARIINILLTLFRKRAMRGIKQSNEGGLFKMALEFVWDYEGCWRKFLLFYTVYTYLFCCLLDFSS